MLKKIFPILVVLLISVSGCGTGRQASFPTLDPVDKVFSSTVAFMNDTPSDDEEEDAEIEDGMVHPPTPSNKVVYRPYCSGAWVARDLILTANHCAAGITYMKKLQGMNERDRMIALYTKNVQMDMKHTIGTEMSYIVQSETNGMEGKPKFTHKGKVVAMSHEHDLALVKVDSLSAPMHQTAKLANTNPKIGSDLMTVGHPGGLIFTISKVIVGGYRDHLTDYIERKGTVGPFIQVVGPIWKGNSGGGLYNERGELVGLVSFVAFAPGQCFGIEMRALKEFLDKNAHKLYP